MPSDCLCAGCVSQGLATIEVAHISAKGVALQVEEHPEGGGQAPVRG